ncbi:MAG: isoprenylcysteine carboxylmethyltransferase family protein, partial [Clostridia bacterium]|nr:isoprenylcysteine carboxylmethyltransferase family protein [Clostridia bacterium]
MMHGLRTQAILKFLCGLILVGLMLFLPAGSLRFFNAWLLIGLLFGPMLIAGLVLLKKAPALLASRLRADEKEPAQRRVIWLSALMFAGGFVVAALDFRFGWSRLPLWPALAASALFSAAYALYAEVLREN